VVNNLGPSLGIHKPYFSEADLREMSSDKVILASTRTRTIVENYLKEMDVPAKYADQMFSVPKDEIRWISNDEFNADFNGFIPGLKDWVDARCYKLTDAEKKIWAELDEKGDAPLSKAENLMFHMIWEKILEQDRCEGKIETDLSLRAYEDALKKYKGLNPH
jgi:hypothetical protein